MFNPRPFYSTRERQVCTFGILLFCLFLTLACQPDQRPPLVGDWTETVGDFTIRSRFQADDSIICYGQNGRVIYSGYFDYNPSRFSVQPNTPDFYVRFYEQDAKVAGAQWEGYIISRDSILLSFNRKADTSLLVRTQFRSARQ